MKLDAILSFVLSILEGGLAGACFYQAGQAKEKRPKVLWYITSSVWFILSLLDGMEATRALKEAKAAAEEDLDLEV